MGYNYRMKYITKIAYLLIFAVIGLSEAVTYGGNYAPNFEFMGDRGYLATGPIGIALGAIVGLVLGTVLVKRRTYSLKKSLILLAIIGLLWFVASRFIFWPAVLNR